MSSKEQNIIDDQNSKNDVKQDKDVVGPSCANLDDTINITDPRDELIHNLEKELSQVKQSAREDVLRLKAEMENVRRRSEQDIVKVHKFALERFSIELLPVIDNLERALGILDKTNNELLSSTIEGIELTLKSFLDVFRRFGVEVVDNVNVPFNPDIHQAMAIVDSNEHEENQVITVAQKGYTLNGRLIRPAMVTVSKNKS